MLIVSKLEISFGIYESKLFRNFQVRKKKITKNTCFCCFDCQVGTSGFRALFGSKSVVYSFVFITKTDYYVIFLQNAVMSFTNKVVIITGASSGIGAETAVRFASLGASVVISGRNAEKLNLVEARCAPAKVLRVIGDITIEQEAVRLIELAIATFGKIDVLVNNAGVLESGSIENTTLGQYDRVFGTNVRAVYHLTMLAVPELIKTKGNIVNVSSVTGTRSFPNALAYCMSKAAVDQLTKCVALEVAGYGVRVNSVNPGVITTGLHLKGGMDSEAYAQFLEKSKTTHALGRPGEAHEVAKSIVFLASDDASFTTGELLHVDGGRHAMCPR